MSPSASACFDTPREVGTDTSATSSWSDWTGVAAGATHTCGLRHGDLYCWGSNTEGELGSGITNNSCGELSGETFCRDLPTKVAGSCWSTVALGYGATCGVRAGALYCWGRNSDAQLGLGSTSSFRTAVTRVGSASDWTAVSLGDLHGCGIRGGVAYCWGSNGYGQIGDGIPRADRVRAVVPTRVGTSTDGTAYWSDWTEIYAGTTSSCGIRGGAMYCWGNSRWGSSTVPRLAQLP